MAEFEHGKAVLVAIAERGSEIEECNISLDELERLLETAGGTASARVIQVKDSFDPRTCIGSGKVKEISEIMEVPTKTVYTNPANAQVKLPSKSRKN